MTASKSFYDATLGTLGLGPGAFDDKGRCFFFTEGCVFALTPPLDGESAGYGNGSSVGLQAGSQG